MDRTRALFVFLLASLISAQAGGLTAADGGSANACISEWYLSSALQRLLRFDA